MPLFSPQFNDAFGYVLTNEGTKYVDLGADRGGPTRYGITLATLRSWRMAQGQPMPTATDVANLAQDEAQGIYSKLYWEKLNCPAMADADVAKALFDAAVLTGTVRVGKLVQNLANKLSPGLPTLLVDGVLGLKSLALLNGCNRRVFLTAFVGAQQDYFLDIVLADPTQQAFHRAWRRRTADYLGLVP